MTKQNIKPNQKKPSGCGCSNIPISIILLLMGGGYWLFSQHKEFLISQTISLVQKIPIPEEIQQYIPISGNTEAPTTATSPNPSSSPANVKTETPVNLPQAPQANSNPPKAALPAKKTAKSPESTLPKNSWETKTIRGVYLSRYAITNNTDETTIRERVRYYHSQGINTIIQGVWGNACTMYNSQVMQETLGYQSCPNEFQEQWLNWLIDEAHQHGMQVHAYFEKGIKIDENSPAFDLAVARKWIVPGVDRTHPGVDHYVLDVEIPEVGEFFKNILVEFVQTYPEIDAVQWDDYLGYYAELPGKVDRTASLTQFVEQMISEMKKANPSVSFDICHHNPYWAKQYFAADWENWTVDRIFIQVYNEDNFNQELEYVKQYDGIAITERQFGRLEELVKNPEVKSILIFPLSGEPEAAIGQVQKLTEKF
jgi:uncharacterized lipoprotein YddW (UPF0748 family)